MRETVLFTVVAVVLYIVSDRLLIWLERRAGRRLEHRSIVFFALLFFFALLAFWVIRNLLEIEA